MAKSSKKFPSGNFFIIPNCIFEEKLEARDFAVYCYLFYRADKKKFNCYPSRSTIAKNCCMTEPTVDKALKILGEKCLINITHRFDPFTGNRLSHLYTINKIWE